MASALYNNLISEILKGPYVKVIDWDINNRTLELKAVDIDYLFKNFQDDFEMLYNPIDAKSLEERILLKNMINEALKYFEKKFNEIGFYWEQDEYGELYKAPNWEKYVEYNFESQMIDNSWGSWYRSSKPYNTEDGEIDTGHEFGKEYDIEAESMVKDQIIKLQEMFRAFKKRKYEYIPTNSNEERSLSISNDKNQPSTLIAPKIKKRQEELRQSIKDEINKMDNKWESAFFNEGDCDHFIEILVSYFTDQAFILPDDPISTKNRCKTKLAKALRTIHTIGTTAKVLRRDLGYTVIIKKLSAFSELDSKHIYNDMIK